MSRSVGLFMIVIGMRYSSRQKKFRTLLKVCYKYVKHALCDHTNSALCSRTFTVALLHFLRTFNISLFTPLP